MVGICMVGREEKAMHMMHTGIICKGREVKGIRHLFAPLTPLYILSSPNGEKCFMHFPDY